MSVAKQILVALDQAGSPAYTYGVVAADTTQVYIDGSTVATTVTVADHVGALAEDDFVALVRGSGDALVIARIGGNDWQAFTPSWTGGTVGATNSGEWRYTADDRKSVEIRFVSEITVTASSGLYFDLPASLDATYSETFESYGEAWLIDDSASTAYHGNTRCTGGTDRVYVLVSENNGSDYQFLRNPSATIPFTWASGDTIKGNIHLRLD